MNLLDMMNSLGHQIRYGVSPVEKYKLMMSGSVPGQPKPFLPGGAENPDAVRFLSNYLGTQQWGAPASAFNTIRYLIDNNPDAFAAGIKGQRAAQTGAPLEQLMASLTEVRR